MNELKDRPTNISVFSRIYEEYTDAEHFFEFARKTAAILFQTSEFIDERKATTTRFLEAASFLYALTLVLPIIMISVGKRRSVRSIGRACRILLS